MPERTSPPATWPRTRSGLPAGGPGRVAALALALFVSPALAAFAQGPAADSIDLPPLPPAALRDRSLGPLAASSGPTGDLVEIGRDPEAELRVVAGRSKFFEARRPLRRVFVGNPAVADVRFLDADQPNPHLIELHGLAFGSTTLTLWDTRDRTTSLLIRVTIDTRDLETRLARVFPGADVRVTQVGAQILLEGQVPDAKVMAEVLGMVETTLRGESALLPVPQAAGDNRQGQAPRVERAAMLQGPDAGPAGQGEDAEPNNPANAAPAAAVPISRSGGGGIAPGTIINRVRVPGPRQIVLKVKIAELNRTALRQFGVNWQVLSNGNTITQQVGPVSPALSQLIGIFDSGRFSLYLNALRQNNLAKILAEPNLVALDGQPARFQAGGRFPYPVPQISSVGGSLITIRFQDFGAILQFIPHIIDDGVIRLDVEPVFSELNQAVGVTVGGTTVPGINQRGARTVVQMREGQTLAIAGLLQTRTDAVTQRIPLAGDLPIVGPLFSKNSVQTQETELIVLVTPELVEPLDKADVPPAPGDRVTEPNDLEFFLLGRTEGKTGEPFRATVHHLDPFNTMRHLRSEARWVVGPHGHAD